MSEIVKAKASQVETLFQRIETSKPFIVADASYKALKSEWKALVEEIEKLNGEVSGTDDGANGNG